MFFNFLLLGLLLDETIMWTIFLLASSPITTTQCDDNKQARGICTMNTRIVCCSSFEFKNEICIQCQPGYKSEINSTCKPCTNDTFGRKCQNKCTCSSNEKCNHVNGSCIHDDRITVEKDDKNKNNSPDTPTKSNNGDVVIYMTCIAVGSVLVVVSGILVKNKEAICRNKSGNNSVKHLIHKLKQPTFHNKKVAESLYDEINEKYMINFDGE